MSVADDFGLIFSGQISDVETVSMMSNIGINIWKWHLLLLIWRHNIGAKLFESGTRMNDSCSEKMS